MDTERGQTEEMVAAAQNNVVLAPVKLEGFSRGKGQGDIHTATG